MTDTGDSEPLQAQHGEEVSQGPLPLLSVSPRPTLGGPTPRAFCSPFTATVRDDDGPACYLLAPCAGPSQAVLMTAPVAVVVVVVVMVVCGGGGGGGGV